MTDSRKRSLAQVALAALALVWGTQFLVIKVGQATVPPLLTVALRFAVVAAASQGVVWIGRFRAPRGALAARALFGVAQAFSMAALYWSEGHLPSALAAILVATEPFFVAVLAHRFVAGERLDARAVVALALGFAGVALIAVDGRSQAASAQLEVIAVVAVLAGSVAGAGNKIIGKRLALSMPAPVVMRDMGVAVAACAAAASLALERDCPVLFTREAVLAIAYLGLVASTGASTVYFVLLRRFSVTGLAYLQFVTSLVAIATGVLLGGERLGPTVSAGAACVLAGLVVRARRARA